MTSRLHLERRILHLVDELLDAERAAVAEPGSLFAWHERNTLLADILTKAETLRTLPLPTEDTPALPSRPTDTQRAAARMHAPRRNSLRLRILQEIIERDGLTCDEVERRLNRAHTSVSSAIHSLARQGWLVDSGLRRTTRQQTPAIVWQITSAGKTQMRDYEPA